MTLLVIKFALVKAYAWVKHHTALLLVIALFVIGVLLFPKKNMKLSDILEMSGRLRRDEFDKIEKTHQQEVESVSNSGTSALEKVIVATTVHDESLKLLEEKKRKEVEILAKSDPDEITRKLAIALGAKVHEMDDVK